MRPFDRKILLTCRSDHVLILMFRDPNNIWPGYHIDGRDAKNQTTSRRPLAVVETAVRGRTLTQVLWQTGLNSTYTQYMVAERHHVTALKISED